MVLGMEANNVMRMMKQAKSIKSPKHFQLLFGKFQGAISHLSESLQDSAKREFRRVAKAGFERNNA
jgi:hypothetical protein